MSSPYVVLGNRSLDQWKVTELKEELKRRKLTTKGLKEDLVKRLDEAVRIELETSKESADNGLAEANISELPSEQVVMEPIVSERAEDLMVKETDVIESIGTNNENEIDDHRVSQGEGRAVEADPVQETNVSGQEGEEIAQSASVETTVLVSETVETTTALSESHLLSVGMNEGGDLSAGLVNEELKSSEEDIKLDLPDPSAHVTQIDESSMSVVPSSEPSQDIETQLENNDSKPDCSVQPPKYQVSEVDPNLGFQVISDSVSTEPVNIIEKNELKVDVITDNVKLELDVKDEMAQPSLSSVVPDVGESHPMDVEEALDKKNVEEPLDIKDVEEPLDKKDVEEPIEKRDVEEPFEKIHFKEPLDKKVSSGIDAENNDSVENVDIGELGPPEKLNLDDAMEEDLLDNKQMDSMSNSNEDNLEKSEVPEPKDEDTVAVVDDKPVETKVSNAETEPVSVPTSAKRKFHDKEATGNNDSLKKPRRWNAEGLKGSDPPSGNIVPSPSPKDASQPTLKRFSRSDSGVNEEAPKERVVPPSSKPATNSLRIDRFLRPFTLKAVQELLGKTGTVASFWMDHIKTHCYVSYATVEEAEKTRNAVYNLQWPPNGGRLLVAEFVDPQEVKTRVEAPPASPATPSTSAAAPNLSTAKAQPPVPAQPSPKQQILRQQLPPPSLPPPPPPPLSNPPPVRERPLPARERLNLPPPPPLLPEKIDPPIVTLDDLFRKTKATPRIYYLPLSDEQVAAKLKSQGKNVIQ